ncbi:DUF192 domain-containing protein [Palaeococcus ferrophilus]|uniref:DUF192 domain-containing protein n=1 Tax=Palaeococcus ferrophilus TaxID=83868 RepID=UPI00064EF87B|nr:DUF192 domain-containing protein [Palaeococcus ferrophilus]
MLINRTKNKVWHGRVEVADTFLKRFRGLMLKPRVESALLFLLPAETRANASIHTFFMLTEIDAIFLNGERRVVDVRRAKPWRLYVPQRAARYVIETPPGVAEGLEVEPGDEIEWIVERPRERAIPAPMGVLEDLGIGDVKGAINLAEPKLEEALKES